MDERMRTVGGAGQGGTRDGVVGGRAFVGGGAYRGGGYGAGGYGGVSEAGAAVSARRREQEPALSTGTGTGTGWSAGGPFAAAQRPAMAADGRDVRGRRDGGPDGADRDGAGHGVGRYDARAAAAEPFASDHFDSGRYDEELRWDGRYDEGPAILADRFEGFQVAAGSGRPEESVFGQVSVRLTSPGEVAAAVPHFFGFVPDDSVVVLGLGPCGAGGQSSICHGMRVDLGDVERDPARFGRWAVERLLDEGAVEAIILIYPRLDADPLPSLYRRLSTLVCAQLRRRNLMPLDSMFVAAGRWWSFLCERPACCPPEGTPVDPAASEVAALSTYCGLVVLPSRGALAETLRPYPSDTVERTRAACITLVDAWEARTGRRWGEVKRDWAGVRELWRLADEVGSTVVGPGWRLPDETAARLLLGMTDVRVRDYLATWCASERAGQALALSVELGRRAVTAEQQAAAYSVAAWASWALGWGAWASLTVERALAAIPDYSLAVLIQHGLERGVGPALVRTASHGTGERLGSMAAQETDGAGRGLGADGRHSADGGAPV